MLGVTPFDEALGPGCDLARRGVRLSDRSNSFACGSGGRLVDAERATNAHLAESERRRGCLPGVVEARPDGWSYKVDLDAPVGFPNTGSGVYGPDAIAVPPAEGPGRLVLYETIPADEAYLESRIEASRNHGGRSQAVIVYGDAAEVWLNETTGELLLGWTLPGKSEVLVGNTADFTVAQLIKSAESVSDCCG